MDPFSGESELVNLSTAFYTHAYPTVVSFDTSSLSASNKPLAQILKYRAQIALGQNREVAAAVSKSKDAASRSILSLAKNDVSLAGELAASATDSEDPTVQICAGSVLAANEDYSTAIELLSKHQGNLEAVSLLVQIHLTQNRTDLALKEVSAAKRWAQDSLLINIAEAWTNLRVGSSEKYQSAFYVYEELATTPGNTSPTALVGQAISELHLGRVEEAEAALNQALESEDADVQAIANAIVLASVTGKAEADSTKELLTKLKARDADHALLRDLEEKGKAFDAAAAKYSAKVAS